MQPQQEAKRVRQDEEDDNIEAEETSAKRPQYDTPQNMSMKPARNYIVTSFNAPPIMRSIFEAEDTAHKIKYVVWQREQCASTGRKHWQMYIELTRPQRPAFVQKLIGDNTAYVVQRKGTPQQAADYCKKTDTRVAEDDGYYGYHEYGESYPAGHRTDIMAIKEAIDNGATIEEVNNKHWKSARTMQPAIAKARASYAKNMGQKIRPLMEVIVYYGPTRTGKTHTAFTEALNLVDQDFDMVHRLERPSTPGKMSFNNYELGKVLIIDEYHDWLHIDQMLSLLDKWPLPIDLKYGSSFACWTRVYITSNLPPREWTFVDKTGSKPPTPEHYQALKARFTHVYYCEEKNKHVEMNIDDL